MEQKEKLTKQELTLLRKGKKQVIEGDFVFWRDVKRTSA
jgi:hypothetical protein